MEENGSLIRLYPVPFRLINDEAQFKKWQWISAKVNEARNDRRRESHRLLVDTIKCDPRQVPSKKGWQERRRYLEKLEGLLQFY
jgi:hypothetical protein